MPNNVVSPIHKKGSRKEPGNYREVAVLSHLRKIIERALDKEMKENYSFDVMQCCFRAKRGTEKPLLRFVHAIKNGHKSAAVLDLRGAYRSVLRAKLLNVLRRLTDNIVNMTSLFLAPDEIQTADD